MLKKLPRSNILEVLKARKQKIIVPEDWPEANRGSESQILATIFGSTHLEDLRLTFEALQSGGLAVVKR